MPWTVSRRGGYGEALWAAPGPPGWVLAGKRAGVSPLSSPEGPPFCPLQGLVPPRRLGGPEGSPGALSPCACVLAVSVTPAPPRGPRRPRSRDNVRLSRCRRGKMAAAVGVGSGGAAAESPVG